MFTLLVPGHRIYLWGLICLKSSEKTDPNYVKGDIEKNTKFKYDSYSYLNTFRN